MNNNYIKGEYKSSIFNGDNGYIVGLFKVKETNYDKYLKYVGKTITFTGYFHEIDNAYIYKLYGDFIDHSKYGTQFQVVNYERIKPEEKDSIIEFLTSGLFKGIGEAKAKKIVDVFGKDSLNAILNNPSNLILIPGITKNNVELLHNTLKEYENSYDTIIKLSNLGFTSKEAMTIYNYYKNKTLEKIASNIYSIIFDIEQINFKRVDVVALKNNTPVDDIKRIEASIIYIIKELEQTYGHSYYYFNELDPFVTRVLGINIDNRLLRQALDNLIKEQKIINKGDCYYRKEMYEAEELIVKRINILIHKEDNKIKNLDKLLKTVEKKLNVKYNEEQEEAIKNSFIKNFSIITGGPGTGKTTILNGICYLFKEINKLNIDGVNSRLALLAPTGRAAKRMTEITGFKASTIHRFLKWNKDTNKFQVNEYNKSKVEFLIIDETSMVDVFLFYNLLKGISVNTKIVLIGDVCQLPSVGPGQILYDLIDSKLVSVSELKYLYRQAEDSNIIKLAYNINENKIDKNIFNIKDDLTFIECQNNIVLDKISEIANTYKKYNYKDFQILAPMYKTINGIDNINEKVEDIFNSKKKKTITINNIVYKENDKVIQLTNMPDENVYNGDIGIIEKIVNTPRKEVYIDFDGNIVKYTPTTFINFKKAYCISIHKSQGSEFDIVVIPLVNNFGKMLYRKLIYTAVTRCKKKLYLVGSFSALEMASNNNQSNVRRTSIKSFLIDGIK